MIKDLSFFSSPISEEIRAEARAEGRAEGRAQGIAESRAEDILHVLDHRGVDVPDEARERIATCGDLDALSRWFDRAITATTAEEIFAQ
ncbi:hypothetical protein ACT1U9_12390 [Streptomyces sp. BR1]|uniref:hypothetical protein n=1 Tax=Streptomyces sp. BR1 TaxID=1592323 RepID=UPI00402BCC12